MQPPTPTLPRAVPVAAKDKSQVTCYDFGNKGHYSNECPTRRMPQPPILMPQLSSSVVFSQEGDMPQGIHSTAMAVFFSCMLKKPRKRQTSCWACFLLIQY